MRADLHTHTTFSDGALTPAQLVALAQEMGLAAVGVTDHDSVDGVPEAMEAGQRLGVWVVPGVEISTEASEQEVHLLGYFLDPYHAPLRAALRQLREGRLRRGEEMVTRLRALGIDVDMKRLLELAGEQGSVGRPHLAQALVELGAAESIDEAFRLYLRRGRPAYVRRQKLAPEQAISLVRDAGGVPVLAHPAPAQRDECIPGWVRTGLCGIETRHPDHDEEDVIRYCDLARRFGLIATAGSDFHRHEGRRRRLGACTSPLSVVKRLEKAAAAIREGRGSLTGS
ncbi:MAG: PHP domain-containing protein [Armatimonadota bacterium]|nr:PHP domain-containing protein [Armatimonadota bacterium]